MKILITGGSSGIGLSTVKTLVAEGHECTVINRSELQNDDVLRQVRVWRKDLSRLEDIETAAAMILAEGGFQVLINNAGGGEPARFEDLTLEVFDQELSLNLTAPFRLMQAVIPSMKKDGFGRIINVSSITGKRGTPYLFSYSAAKAGLNSLTQSTARYLATTGITVNAICPGGVDTEMSVKGRAVISAFNNTEPEHYQKNMITQMGLGRLISPEEVADMIMYLIRPESSFITGQCINVCGALELL